MPAGPYDRAFYSGMAIAMAIVVFVGFGPTFYLRSLFGAPVTISGAATLSPLAQFHGAVFTCWVLLFIIQTALVANHRVAVHRRLGVAGGVLAVVMVTVGTMTAIKAAARGSAPPGADALGFLIIPFGDMVLFTILAGAALALRRNKEAHKRLMLLAYIAILVAGVARWPGVIQFGPPLFFGLTFIFLVLAVVYDFWSRRRIHAAYIWGGALLVASVPLRLMLSGTQAWRAIAQFLVGL
jgi:uncharacterized membrane protein YhaH (DUF805 family)